MKLITNQLSKLKQFMSIIFRRIISFMQIKGIASDTLIFILETCKSTAPEEFAGLLHEKDGIITEVLILPGTNQVNKTQS